MLAALMKPSTSTSVSALIGRNAKCASSVLLPKSSECVSPVPELTQRQIALLTFGTEAERALVAASFVGKVTDRAKEMQEHRVKHGFYPLKILGLVTNVPSKSDKEYQSSDTQEALLKEITKLEHAGVG